MKATLLFAAAILPLCLPGCGDKPAADADKPAANAGKTADGTAPFVPGSSAPAPAKSTGSEAEVKELLAAFVKPGADRQQLTAELRPETVDYDAVFIPEFASKIETAHKAIWVKNPSLGKEEQTEFRIKAAVPTTDIKAWNQNASDHLPGGYERIKDNFKDGFTVYAFDFVKPGETAGMAFSGLVHVNGHWRLFPDPHRVK